MTAGQVVLIAEALRDERPKPKTAREKLKSQPKLSKKKLVEIAARRNPGVKTTAGE
jgi:hypothetical protein